MRSKLRDNERKGNKMDNFKEYDNDQYNQGIELDEFRGEISLVSARRGEDGRIFKEWVAPIRNKKPIEKHLPWKIKLGNSPEEAIETLRYFIALLGGGTSAPEYSGPPVDDGGEIPF